MALCPHCGYDNRPGVLYCEDCARELFSKAADGSVSTEQVEADTLRRVVNLAGSGSQFKPNFYLVVHIRDAVTPIVVQLNDGRVVFGRKIDRTTHIPDVDLTQYGALEKGVSHFHAAIEFTGENLILVDLGSVNGTYVNGQRLIAKKGQLICDGDEIRLGKLIAHVYFQGAA